MEMAVMAGGSADLRGLTSGEQYMKGEEGAVKEGLRVARSAREAALAFSED
jgi:hypothetical protein